VDEEQLLELGKRMKTAFENALEQGFEALTPKSTSTTSADLSNKPPPKRNGRVTHTADVD
jgi:hypothetical protein